MNWRIEFISQRHHFRSATAKSIIKQTSKHVITGSLQVIFAPVLLELERSIYLRDEFWLP